MKKIFLLIFTNLFFIQLFANQEDLIMAIKSSDRQRVSEILNNQNCVDLNAEDAFGRTPLFYASQAPILRRLLRHGAKVQTDVFGMNPLHYFFAYRCPMENISAERMKEGCITAESLRYVLLNPRPLEYQMDKFGKFPAEYLQGNWPEALLRVLNNPLMFAVIRNDLLEVERLLESGKSVNSVDHLGRRPIFYVNDDSMFHLLVRHGALLSKSLGSPHLHTDRFGQNPLHTLFAMTTPNLLDRYPDDEETIKRIEAVAFLLIRMQIQENGSGVFRSRAQLETQRDLSNKLPGHYLNPHQWRPDFIERIHGDHIRDYRSPNTRRLLAPNEN